jgi:polysaccharide pyruvyl transferase WcaK-like protein
MSQNFALTNGYFDGAQQVHLPDVFPPFLSREIPKHHGVVVVEGSTFKSKFTNALTTMIVGAIGIATGENKLAVGYGSEAGKMEPSLRKLVARHCGNSLVVTRNEESRTVLRELGVPTELGTDTAWTFQPLAPDYGRKALHDAGWDGRLPVLILCPINPFWWPVKPSLAKYAAVKTTGAYKDSQYRSLYFHNSGPEVDAAFERYLTAFAKGADAFRQRHKVFTVMVAMEQLDTIACGRISEKLGGVPVFSSSNYDMYQLVSILRAGHIMASSRFHGIVTSMPALVPSCGITMDERIRNLMHERGHEDLLMNVDDPDLEPKLLAALEKLAADGERIADGIGRTVVKNLKVMARMGVYFEEELQRRYPEFPTRKGQWSWEDYLPPLDAGLQRLVGMYG